MANSMLNSPELTAEEVKNILITPLEHASVVLAQGPQIFDSPKGAPLLIPRLDSVGDAGWYGENQLITDVDADFGEVQLLPSNLASLKVLHKFSNELARHSVVSLASTMQTALVSKVADAMDTAFLVGSGAAVNTSYVRVTGLYNKTGIQTATFDVTTAADLQDSAIDVVGKLLTKNITNFSKVVWFMNPATYLAALKVKDSSGKGLLVSDPQASGIGYTLQGIRVVPTDKVAEGTGLVVDMNYVAVGRDLAPSVKVLDQTFGDYDQLALRVVARMDIALLHNDAAIKVTDTLE